MFDAVDEALRRLLIKEIPIKNKEIDIVFDAPKREWAARLSRPTINVFLYDFRENRRLRGADTWHISRNSDGTVAQKRPPLRVDLHFLVTVWTDDPEDEHSLLTNVLIAMMRNPNLPKDILPEELLHQPAPILMQVGQEDDMPSPADLWGVLDNEIHPAVVATVTIMVDPYQPVVTRMVRTREFRYGQRVEATEAQKLSERAGISAYWTVGGSIKTALPYPEIHLVLAETGKSTGIDADGRFSFGRLRAGDYTLQVHVGDRTLKQHTISIPSPDFELEV